MDRISLSNTAFEGNNNVYLFADGPETTLVDTGDGTDATREKLRAALDERDVDFADVDRIVLTHWHTDHVGLAGAIQAESGATVHVHEADAPLVAGDEPAWESMLSTMERCFEEWGMPDERRSTVREAIAGTDDVDEFPQVEPFRDGETFPVGDGELRAVHVSGHAAGLCIFEIDRAETGTGDGTATGGATGDATATGGGAGERTGGGEATDASERDILSSDALLPVYTPNVGGADIRVDEPLARYVDGLRRIEAAEYVRAWPGHRHPIDDPSARAAEIVAHHEERAWRVLDVLRRRGPCDAWTVSADLFGSLDGIHVLHGPGEAYAHLDHLERRNVVVRDGSDYRLAEDTADRLASLADERWSLES